jgi:hypothetical protein
MLGSRSAGNLSSRGARPLVPSDESFGVLPVLGRGVTVEPGGTGAPELSYCGGILDHARSFLKSASEASE